MEEEEKGSFGGGFVLGFVLGIIGMIICIAINKPKNNKRRGLGVCNMDSCIDYFLASSYVCSIWRILNNFIPPNHGKTWFGGFLILV